MTRQVAWELVENSHWSSEEQRQAMSGTADRVRLLIDSMVHLDPDAPIVEDLARHLDSALELLGEHQQNLEQIHGPDAPHRSGIYLDRSPVSGVLNPMAPPLKIERDGEYGARSTTTLGLPYQGPPHRVHGGYVATLLDHIMGFAAGTVDRLVYTRELTVEYIHATPLFEELEITGRIDRADGRKLWVLGEVRAQGRVVATGRGLWLSPRDAWES